MLEFIRSLVRPVVTVLFAVASVYFTAIKIMPVEAFLILATAAIVWWYKDRSEEKEAATQEYVIDVTEKEKAKE